MPAVIGTATSSDWSSGGALLTFFFPIVLFLVIAAALYLEFTRQHTVPGLRANPARGSTSPGQPHARTAHDDEADGPD